MAQHHIRQHCRDRSQGLRIQAPQGLLLRPGGLDGVAIHAEKGKSSVMRDGQYVAIAFD
jgi:hypothetical protein